VSLKHYGVLRGRVIAAQREDGADTPHYQVRVAAAGTDYRLAVNVMSSSVPRNCCSSSSRTSSIP
jgi:uncharacterized protein YukJ